MNRQRRTGATETFSVSVDPETKSALKARADRLYGGNMSALITALAREAERAEAVARLVARAGGSTLTDARRLEIDAQLERTESPSSPSSPREDVARSGRSSRASPKGRLKGRKVAAVRKRAA
jgi:hypothetical protein